MQKYEQQHVFATLKISLNGKTTGSQSEASVYLIDSYILIFCIKCEFYIEPYAHKQMGSLERCSHLRKKYFINQKEFLKY